MGSPPLIQVVGGGAGAGNADAQTWEEEGQSSEMNVHLSGSGTGSSRQADVKRNDQQDYHSLLKLSILWISELRSRFTIKNYPFSVVCTEELKHALESSLCFRFPDRGLSSIHSHPCLLYQA